MCLSQAMAGCVLWPSQDMEFSLLATELGPKLGKKIEEKQCFSSGSRYSELSRKSVPLATGTGRPTHYLLLGMK